MNFDKFLPLGTIVMLKEGTHKIMIIGYTPQLQNSKQIYDYSACLFPEGFIGPNQIFAFNHDDISKVYYIGYKDDGVVKMNDYLKDFQSKYINDSGELTKEIHEIIDDMKGDFASNE